MVSREAEALLASGDWPVSAPTSQFSRSPVQRLQPPSGGHSLLLAALGAGEMQINPFNFLSPMQQDCRGRFIWIAETEADILHPTAIPMPVL
jgi:hypothetical protein